MPSPGADIFAPPSPEELQSAKVSMATKPKAPVDDIFAPPSEDEMLAARQARPQANGLVNKQNVQGELGGVDRSVLSFASNDEEKAAYLQKKYPGAEVGQMDTGKKRGDGTPETVMVFKMPGEARFRYIDDPSLTLTDAADFIGDIPAAVIGTGAAALAAPTGPGAIAAGAGGAAVGEGARKGIGYGLLGIPRKQSLTDAAVDVALSGAGGAIVPGAMTLGKGLLSKGAKVAASEVADVAADTAAPAAKQGMGLIEGGVQDVVPYSRSRAPSINTADDLAGYISKQDARMAVPETLDDLGKVYRADQAAGKSTSLPSKVELEGALKALGDLENAPTKMHLDMLDSQSAKDIVQLRKNLPSADAEALNYYEQKMKGELVDKFKNSLEPLVKREAMPLDEAGETLMDATRTRYNAVRKNLAPEFDKLRDLPADPVASLPGLQDKIQNAIPSLKGKIKVQMVDKAGKALPEGAEGGILKAQLEPYKPSMGISKETYSLMNEVLDDVSTPKTFKEMQNIRETLRKALDPTNPKATRELESLRGAMLDHMEELAAAQNPGVQVRELFKAWAQNEGRYELAQKVMKGSLDTLDPTKRPSPEKILNSVFLNQKSVAAAKEAFGEQEVAAMAHDMINDVVKKATRQGSVSSAALQQFLKQKGPVIEEALRGADPQTAKAITGRLKALVDVMRIIPDAPPINPSGTAKTTGLINALGKGAKSALTMDAQGLLGAGRQAVEAVGEQRAGSAAKKELDQIMKGVAKEERGKGLIRRGAEAAQKQLKKPSTRGLVNTEAGAATRDSRK